MARQRRRRGSILHWISGFESRLAAAAWLTFGGPIDLTTNELEAVVIELDDLLDKWTKAAIRAKVRRDRGMGEEEIERLYDLETWRGKRDGETTETKPDGR